MKNGMTEIKGSPKLTFHQTDIHTSELPLKCYAAHRAEPLYVTGEHKSTPSKIAKQPKKQGMAKNLAPARVST